MDYDQLVQTVLELQERLDELQAEDDARNDMSLAQMGRLLDRIFIEDDDLDTEGDGTMKDTDDKRIERTETVTIPDGGGSQDVTYVDFPDQWLIIDVKGKKYRLPVYDISA